MTADGLSKDERMEASRQAQTIQKTINTASGRQFVRCSAPMILIRPRDVSSPIKGRGMGLNFGSSRL